MYEELQKYVKENGKVPSVVGDDYYDDHDSDDDLEDDPRWNKTYEELQKMMEDE